MFLLVRVLVLADLALTIYCVIDCIQTPEISIRNLPKWAWILLILFFSPIGWIAWLMAGRPIAGARHQEHVTGYPEYHRSPRTAPSGPDDDPDFLRALGRVNSEQEQTLQKWEADLRRREEELRRRGEQPPSDPA